MQQPDSPAASQELPRGLVLLVDDDVMVLRALARLLKDLPAEVHQRANAAEALALIESGLAPEVVISDNALGRGMSGLQLLASVHRCRPGAWLALHTGDATVSFQLEPGAVLTVFAKPVPTDTLRRFVAMGLGR